MKYHALFVIFENCRLLQIIGGALRFYHFYTTDSHQFQDIYSCHISFRVLKMKQCFSILFHKGHLKKRFNKEKTLSHKYIVGMQKNLKKQNVDTQKQL